MILAIDIGNTTVTLGGLEKQNSQYEVCFVARMATVPGQSAAECYAELKWALSEAAPNQTEYEGAILVSVVPALNSAMRAAAKRLTGSLPVEVDLTTRTGLTLCLPHPETLGHDRLADAAYAAAYLPLPALTVDMGTATTFNLVDEGGKFRGGIIAAGLATGLNALAGKTAQLPEIQLQTPDYLIGDTTEKCMLSGAVNGAAAMVDGVVARLEQELKKPVSLILTGGLARYVEPLCRHPHQYDPSLLLKGLALLYEMNR